MRRYGKHLGGRTARKEFLDRIRHPAAKIYVLFDTAHFLVLARRGPLAGVQKAFVFGLGRLTPFTANNRWTVVSS